MLTRFFGLFLIIAVSLAGLAHGEVYLTEEQALKLAFPDADSVEKQLVALTAAERTAIDAKLGSKDAPRIFKYWVGKKKGNVVGYAAIDDVLGKDQPITYMLSVDGKLAIHSVEILAYRESRGGEVRRDDWRAQFEGKNAASTLRIGSDIRNIAGATISCRSLTDGVRRQITCLSVLVKPVTTAVTREENRTPATTADGGTTNGNHPQSRGEPARAAASRSAHGELVSRNQLLMGTTFEIRAYVDNRESGAALLEFALVEVARLEAILSTWQAESEVSRLNRSAGGDWQAASPELLDLCARSIETSSSTSGAFDVSAGPLITLWKNAADTGRVPTTNEIRVAREHTGFGGIELDRAHGKLRLARAGMALDFGAIGKGYALDRAAMKLEEHGIHSALLDFGGQLLALDPPPDETAWVVGVRDPAQPDRTIARIRLARASISSSGDYERGMKLDNKTISHIVDPHTGLPVESMLGTSVVTPTAVEADALSTALYVLGFEGATQYAEAHGLCALIDAAGGRVLRTKGFQSLEIVDEKSR